MSTYIPGIVAFSCAITALVIILIYRNRKDRNNIRPDSQDAVEEVKRKKERKKEES